MNKPAPFRPENHVELKTIVSSLLHDAKQLGATQADVMLAQESGFSVAVRMGETETLEHNRGKSLSVTIYFDKRAGSATTSDFSDIALRAVLEKAASIARYTESDPHSGLADADVIAYEYPDLDLHHPWHITPEQGIELAKECEDLARNSDKLITNSEGAYVNTHNHYYVHGNSHEFMGDYSTSYHSINCALIAQRGYEMESDSDYTCARDPVDLLAIPLLAKNVAQRTVQRLGARKISTRQSPVIFSAETARGLLGHFLSAISGSNLYRKSSFLLDCLGKPVFPKYIQITENPHLLKGFGSAPFDFEGVKSKARNLIKDGILEGYLLSSYSARRLGMKTTGNAGGAHNIFIAPGEQDFPMLLKTMGTGLLVTGLMGQGVNMVTGDYSRGAYGYWVEGGEIQYPVHEITVAGNLKEIYANLASVAKDVDHRGNVHTGSVLVESMMIAGE